MLEGMDVLRLYGEATALERRAQAVLARVLPVTLTPIEALTLYLIGEGVATPSALAAATERATPTISHILASAYQHGLVEWHRSSEDGRVRRLSLTLRGHRLLGSVEVASVTRITPESIGRVRNIVRAMPVAVV